jgi:deazaflavin-dependent oxidoreductase (nitroreductase family)
MFSRPPVNLTIPLKCRLGCSPRTSGRGILPPATGRVHRVLRRRGCSIAATYRLSRWRRLLNALVRTLLRMGLGPRHTYLLTMQGRRSSTQYSTPVTLVYEGTNHWLVAPYGEASWVRNARAAGQMTLSRGRHAETVASVELEPAEAAPVLKQYITQAPLTRPFFDATPNSSLNDVRASAPSSAGSRRVTIHRSAPEAPRSRPLALPGHRPSCATSGAAGLPCGPAAAGSGCGGRASRGVGVTNPCRGLLCGVVHTTEIAVHLGGGKSSAVGGRCLLGGSHGFMSRLYAAPAYRKSYEGCGPSPRRYW